VSDELGSSPRIGHLKPPPFFSFSPGIWSKLKEKGAVAKDAWGVIGSACVISSFLTHSFLTGSLLAD